MDSSASEEVVGDPDGKDADTAWPSVAANAFVSPQATLQGRVTVGEETLIGPGCVIEALKGEIVLGKRNVIDDGTRITHSSDSTLRIGDGNWFEAACDVNCPSSVGNFNVLEAKAALCPGSSLADGCYVCAGMALSPNTKLGVGEAVFGQRAERQFENGALETCSVSLDQNLPLVRGALQASSVSGGK